MSSKGYQPVSSPPTHVIRPPWTCNFHTDLLVASIWLIHPSLSERKTHNLQCHTIVGDVRLLSIGRPTTKSEVLEPHSTLSGRCDQQHEGYCSDWKLSVLIRTTTILYDVDEKVILTPNINDNDAVLSVVSATCGGGCGHYVFSD